MAGTLVLDTLQNGAGTASTSADNVINGSAKAWVNFNGTTTITIRASYNISSIVRNSAGIYTANFTNALADVNYVVTGGVGYKTGFTTNPVFEVNGTGTPAITSSSFQFYTVTGNQAVTDADYIYFSVFR